jgi:multiple sugar transport system substrate-binding protein
VLSGHYEAVDSQPNDGAPWLTRLNAELQAGFGIIGVLGALHGDLSVMNPNDLANINALTYDQMIAWSKNVMDATGEAKFGFPAGPKGLKHRFFQGYLYLSYTNGVVRTFASDEAVPAWEKMRELWAVTNPSSTNFSFLQEQLLS